MFCLFTFIIVINNIHFNRNKMNFECLVLYCHILLIIQSNELKHLKLKIKLHLFW